MKREPTRAISSAPIKSDTSNIDLKRYRKVRWFFAKVFLQAIWWDLILNRPILRVFRTPPLPRWRAIARNYRKLALEMGGVLIKLGQFLSIRVDILPSEVIQELKGLQDEVPPENLEDIIAQIEADFGCPLSEIFEWFSPIPLGSASLAQAHEVRVVSGEELVVKVLRPRVDVLVETDLKAIVLALGWLKCYKSIRERVDLDWLAEEFTLVTRRELDFEAEALNAERLADDFADDTEVCFPKVHWEYCAPRILAMEHVGYLKIGDLEAIEAAGISRVKVADKLYDVYMRQVFETHFVHVDPHPGNLFVRPLPHPDEIEAGITDFGPGDVVPYKPDRPFQLVFVDFGMSVKIPERLQTSLREYAIGVGTHDARKIVQSLVKAGALLEGADLNRLEQAHETLFRHLWGVRVGKMRDVALKEARTFIKEYKDVIYDEPFQFQADMLFIMRAIGILSGMAANLYPDFDVWTKTIPYAERYAKEELLKNGNDWLREAVSLGQLLLTLPARLDSVANQAEQGKLTIQTALSTDTRKAIQRLEQSVSRLAWMVLSAGLLVSGVNLHVGDKSFSGILIFLAILAFLWGIRKK
ncbi:ABC1 kinase family protein [Desulfonema magnum]|uniref:UbiB domain-containing protein n=1 Tax=Desulfonema magnum TaxID=45655 RepID=A0A975BTM4_9BACT|nr:AarF/UbiB family protein [Desulfonema magnum]QTA91431.1 UbiB domain-containing protein [Desulfonema magnum]